MDIEEQDLPPELVEAGPDLNEDDQLAKVPITIVTGRNTRPGMCRHMYESFGPHSE